MILRSVICGYRPPSLGVEVISLSLKEAIMRKVLLAVCLVALVFPAFGQQQPQVRVLDGVEYRVIHPRQLKFDLARQNLVDGERLVIEERLGYIGGDNVRLSDLTEFYISISEPCFFDEGDLVRVYVRLRKLDNTLIFNGYRATLVRMERLQARRR
jgi:hypothetical protein